MMALVHPLAGDSHEGQISAAGAPSGAPLTFEKAGLSKVLLWRDRRLFCLLRRHLYQRDLLFNG
jgi:hypothetical protein